MLEETLEEKVKRLEKEVETLREQVGRCVIREEPEPTANVMMTEPVEEEGELPSPEAGEEVTETEEEATEPTTEEE